MPRPTPDYIPSQVLERIPAGESPKEFAVRKGLHPNRFYAFFGSPHSTLQPYIRLCQSGGIELDELVIILSENRFAEFIEIAKEKQKSTSIPELCKKIGVSNNFVYEKLKTPGLNGLGSYLEMAKALDWSVSELAKICIR